MVGELQQNRTDIALGALSVTAEREAVVDFTVPYYDLVGISVLVRRTQPSTNLFKFMSVFEMQVREALALPENQNRSLYFMLPLVRLAELG